MRIINLQDVASIDISNVDKKIKNGEKEVVLCNFVDVYHNWAITSRLVPNMMRATANENQLQRFTIKKGQVAITKDSETRDDIGIPTYIADNIPDAVLGYHCALITPNETLLVGKYLNVVLHSPYAKKYFEANASGSGQRYTLTSEIIGGFPVPLYDIPTQKSIGELFSNIDKQIENNNAICSDLESMAKLLYDYWFVQFDFPDENGKPYKSSGGKMVWNEELKREIPEGWKAGRIKNLGEVIGGATPSTGESSYYTNSGIPWATPKDLSDNDNVFFSHGERDITEQGLNSCSAVLMPKGTVMMTSRAPIGYLAIAANNVCTNQGFKSVVPREDFGTYFTYFTLRIMMPYIKRYGVGSTFAEVSKQDVENIQIVLPPKGIVGTFNKKVNAVFEQIFLSEEESKQLAELRDFLLPMLMNGQVKVGGVAE